jgi:hypothetical protein
MREFSLAFGLIAIINENGGKTCKLWHESGSFIFLHIRLMLEILHVGNITDMTMMCVDFMYDR